jgi:hypothetical protein
VAAALLLALLTPLIRKMTPSTNAS